jgi:hypothetical protein
MGVPAVGFRLLCIPVHPAYAVRCEDEALPMVEPRKVISTTTFCAGVFWETRTETSEAGRFRRQFLSGVRNTVAGVDGGRLAEAA